MATIKEHIVYTNTATGYYDYMYFTFKWWVESESSEDKSITIGWDLFWTFYREAGTQYPKQSVLSGYDHYEDVGLVGEQYKSDRLFNVTIDGTKYTSSEDIELFMGRKWNYSIFTGTHTFTDLDESTAYTFNVGITDAEADITITLPPINKGATILTAPNFNDEESPTITYALPTYTGSEVKGLQACISFDNATPDIAYRAIPTNGVSYTFNLTEAEREVLRAKVQGAATAPIYFIIKTTRVIDGVDTDFLNYSQKTLTIIGCTPVITATVRNISTDTVALTGNEDTIVKYHSNIAYEINATGSKGATIVHHQIICGSKSSTEATGTLYNVDSGKIVLTAVDSRDIIASEVIDKPFIDYVKLTCNIVRKTATPDGVIAFGINGNYYNGSFGAANNTIALKYRYKVNSGAYGNWVTVTPTLKGNTYSIDVELTGLDYRNSYTFEAQAVDQLETTTSTAVVIKTTPVFDWSDSDFNFNVPVTFTDKDNKSYSISDAVKGLNGLDVASISKIKGIANAMSNRYELTCDVSVGANYSTADVSLYLYGNTIRGYFSITRNSAVAAGNVANEYVCQVQFDSGKKVIGFGAVSFCSGPTGGIASFHMDETYIYQDDGSVSEEQVGQGVFNIRLCSTTVSGSEWSGYFSFPCLIDLSKY